MARFQQINTKALMLPGILVVDAPSVAAQQIDLQQCLVIIFFFFNDACCVDFPVLLLYFLYPFNNPLQVFCIVPLINRLKLNFFENNVPLSENINEVINKTSKRQQHFVN